MEKLQDLKALLQHEIQDIYSAEEQIIDALPKMIDKASNAKLKKALQNHLKVTKLQKTRLDKIQQLMEVGEDERGNGKKGGLLGLFSSGGKKCKGTEGLIKEGESIMSEDIDPDVMDAAIIASCQKIEHYEICSYGTMKAYAQALKLTQVTKLLNETLNEEYEADDLLTELAVNGGLNEKAEGPESRTSSHSTQTRGSATEREIPGRSGSSRSENSATSRSSSRSRSSTGKKSSSKAKKSSTSGKSKSSSSTKRKTASSKK
jgi:ferritin-like metal-binding protein YciE